MTIQEFITKYGTDTPELFVTFLILRAPEFEGDKKLAIVIGRMMADLTSALQAAKEEKDHGA